MISQLAKSRDVLVNIIIASLLLDRVHDLGSPGICQHLIILSTLFRFLHQAVAELACVPYTHHGK